MHTRWILVMHRRIASQHKSEGLAYKCISPCCSGVFPTFLFQTMANYYWLLKALEWDFSLDLWLNLDDAVSRLACIQEAPLAKATAVAVAICRVMLGKVSYRDVCSIKSFLFMRSDKRRQIVGRTFNSVFVRNLLAMQDIHGPFNYIQTMVCMRPAECFFLVCDRDLMYQYMQRALFYCRQHASVTRNGAFNALRALFARPEYLHLFSEVFAYVGPDRRGYENVRALRDLADLAICTVSRENEYSRNAISFYCYAEHTLASSLRAVRAFLMANAHDEAEFFLPPDILNQVVAYL